MSETKMPNREIVQEIYAAMVLLGAQFDLLGTVGSWGDSLSDDQVLCGLRAWNSGALKEIKERIGHYESSLPHSACSQAEARQIHQAV